MRITAPSLLIAWAAITLPTTIAAQPPEGPWFVDMAAVQGMDNLGTGRGTAVFDFDGDGWIDVFQTHSDGPNTLYRNRGTGFEDVTESAGVGGGVFHWGASAGDYDNDGDTDLYVTVGGLEGSGPNLLYRNDANHFTEVAEVAGVAGVDSKSASPVWLDYNLDGWLDLFVINYNPFPVELGESLPDCSQHVLDRLSAAGAAPPKEAEIASNLLYRNNRDGTFTDVTAAAGLFLEDRSFGVTTGDFDRDGFTDIYVAGFKAPNRLYRNMGDGTFIDVAVAAGGLDTPWASMSPAFADFDNDGWLDLFVGTWNSFRTGEFEPGEPNYLFRNRGDGTFAEIAENAGVEHVGGHMGVQVADFDLDGWPDIYLGSGGPNAYERQQDLLFHNNRSGGFNEVDSEVSGINNMFMAHGVAFADFDRDGDLDFFVGNGGPADKGNWSNQPNRLYMNVAPANNSLVFVFDGVRSNRSGLGTVVEAFGRGFRQRRELAGASGFASHNGVALPLGFGSATSVDLVTVTWPSGAKQSKLDVAVNQRARLVEPELSVEILPITGTPPIGEIPLHVRLFNMGPARRVLLRLEILDPDREAVHRYDDRALELESGARRDLSFHWESDADATGRWLAVAHVIDADSGAEVNLGATPLEFE